MKKQLKRQWGAFMMLCHRMIFFLLLPFVKVRKNRIVFSTFGGKGFGDNSKYIALELIRRKLPLELIWLTSPDEKSVYPPEIRRVPNTYLSELYYLMSAGVWVDTHLKRHIFKKGLLKRRNQFYVQTWHGSLGIKNMPTVEEVSPGLYYPMLTDIRSIDCMVSNSKFEDIKYREYFATDTVIPPICKLGHPRNDVFFQDNCAKIKMIKSRCSVGDDVRIFTYMPTFRKKRDLSAYTLDFARVVKALETRFGGKWVIFMRLHPSLAAKAQDHFSGIADVIDVSSYPDSQELQIASDILCTDYSSAIFDFVLSRRPGFIFASDLNDYSVVRGLCYPLTETPFPVAENNDDLIRNIELFDESGYLDKVERFLEYHGCVDDGGAAARVVDRIENFINRKNSKLSEREK